MKRFVVLAGVALLAACGAKKEAATPEVAATNTMDNAMAVAPAVVTANGATPGKYDVTEADGSKHISELKADGTYQDWQGDKATEQGTGAVKDGKTCFVPQGKAEQCYTEGARAADGSFSATGADGKVAQGKPHAG